MIPLFKKTSTGALQTWEIWTEDNVIVTRWGQVNGAMQEGRDTIQKGKNQGKKNATTAAEQASLEAQSQWEKKLKKGYVQDPSAAQAGERDAVITGGVDPMLAHTFAKQGHKLKYPCYYQPKIDGHRCIAVVSGGKCTLWTRTRKPITGLPHLVAAIEALGIGEITFDGELYNHDYRAKFEELTSFIRSPDGKPGSEVVQYHIYDLADHGDLEFYLRTKCLADFGLKEPLVMVQTEPAENEEDLMLAFERYLKAGYEGAMARNSAGPYVGKRSYDLLKIKEFQDSEFTVTGVEEGRGKLAGHAIFVCSSPGGTFKAKLMGDTSALKGYFDNPETAIGRQLTVKYQGLTGKNGVPRFPVAVRFRD